MRLVESLVPLQEAGKSEDVADEDPGTVGESD
jgi:hypothetical protein